MLQAMKRDFCIGWFAAFLAASLGCNGLIKRPTSNPQQLDAEPTSQAKLTPEQKADMQRALAQGAELAGDAESAIKAYRSALQITPHNSMFSHRLAVLHDQKGQIEVAEQYYQTAMNGMPNSPKLHSDLGYHFYLKGNYDEAESHLRRSLAIQPDNPLAFNNLGMLLARTGRRTEALRAFAAAGISENEAHANMSFAFLSENQVDAATEELHLAQATPGDSGFHARIAPLQRAIYQKSHSARRVIPAAHVGIK